MQGLLWSFLGVVAGGFIAVQAPINAQLGKAVGSPVAGAAISFLSGTLILGVCVIILSRMQLITTDLRGPAPWLFVAGGFLGALYVTSTIIVTPRVGTAAMMAFLVTGQLCTGIILDRMGFLNEAIREISLGRIVGAALLITGAIMIRVY